MAYATNPNGGRLHTSHQCGHPWVYQGPFPFSREHPNRQCSHARVVSTGHLRYSPRSGQAVFFVGSSRTDTSRTDRDGLHETELAV